MIGKGTNLACVHTPGTSTPKGDMRCMKCRLGPFAQARIVASGFLEQREQRARFRRSLQAEGIKFIRAPRWRNARAQLRGQWKPVVGWVR